MPKKSREEILHKITKSFPKMYHLFYNLFLIFKLLIENRYYFALLLFDYSYKNIESKI